MKAFVLAVAAASPFLLWDNAQAGDGWPRVCWNPPDAVEPGFVPCGPLTGLNSPRRVDGVFGAHPDEWYFNIPSSPPGITTGGGIMTNGPPDWE